MRRCFALTVLLISSGCTNPVQEGPDWRTILERESSRITAKDSSISCMQQPKDGLGGFDCIQEPTAGDKRHFALLSMRVRLAAGSRSASSETPVSASIGPGGGGATWRNRTRDGAYDLFATELQNLTGQQRSALPSAPALIRQTLAAYDASKSPKGE